MKNNKGIIIILLIFLFNCSEKTIDEENQNTRFSVLKYNSEISEDLMLDISEVKLGDTREVFYWSKDFQNPQNNISHISSNANFNKKEKIVSGKPKPLNLIQPIFYENILCYLISNGYVECLNTETNKVNFTVDIKKEDVKKYEFVRGCLDKLTKHFNSFTI